LTEDFDWDAVPLADLPEELRSKTREQQVAAVAAMRKQRESIQTEIQRVSDERETVIRNKQEADVTGLGDAMRRAIREQAKAKGFKCDGC
jgi:flagellar biosynthesis chaperone FliJ